MSSNISVDYDAVQQMARQLATSADNITTQTQALRGQFSQLVTSPSLHLDQTSGPLHEHYQQFDAILASNVKGLQEFGGFLNNIVAAMQDMDGKIAKSIAT
ncbi:WXG100 family type VII secretion target [Kitasatospora sp. NPDC059571]|uniref:WXG100 family type VII secretion target n=1 Tax=Kitasatospora sp. NPDC059571 TaxID=3346871 RepID=UPI003674306D